MVVIDLFGTLDEFIDYHAHFRTVAKYYLIYFPEIFVLITPMSLLLGLLFCLSNLGKNNELTAMRASGVSLFRLSAPLLGIGLVASVCVFGVSEMFVPHAKGQREALMSALKGRIGRDVLQNFFYANTAERRDWYARRFNTQSLEMENPEVHDCKPDGAPDFDVYAERAQWADGQWRFFKADVYDHKENPPSVTHVAETNFPAIKDPPKRMAVEGKDPDELSSAELRRYIRNKLRMGLTTGLARYEVAYHTRYAFPLICFIVVLLGIPMGMRVSRSGPLLGVGTALVLVVAYYFLQHITRAFGEGGHIPPIVAAWMTNGIFAGVGLVLLIRAR